MITLFLILWFSYNYQNSAIPPLYPYVILDLYQEPTKNQGPEATFRPLCFSTLLKLHFHQFFLINLFPENNLFVEYIQYHWFRFVDFT